MTDKRRPIVAGNWKMNTTLRDARELATALREPLAGLDGVDSVLCPPFVYLIAAGEVIEQSNVALGAQNCHVESKGAFTGEVSPAMLVDVGCRYVILGHSERRRLLKEDDALIRRKLESAVAHGLVPIVCTGENLAENEAGRTTEVVGGQLRAALHGLGGLLGDDAGAKLVVAYEPVWAIGTGRPATAQDAGATIGSIRRTLVELLGEAAAAAVRIQYGGSVTPANAAELFAQPEIDGALVGGASLKAPDFFAICRAAAAAGL
ncbi:MAG: triose-phosphate isomerase [Chloroflexi bacterium]|nr:triose-phosphate isomerase [Chloroflexota bacterium]